MRLARGGISRNVTRGRASPPTTIANPSSLLFRDTFEYAVDRNTDGAAAIFQTHGWEYAKTEQDVLAGNPYGFIYTTSAVPGYGGALPATGGILCIEALPATYSSQTDVYLEYGNGEDAFYNEFIPGDVWIQYWYYINHSGTQLSQQQEQKFVYACNGPYGCHTQNWMVIKATNSRGPLWNDLGLTNGDSYITVLANWEKDTVVNPFVSDPGDVWKLGQTNISEWLKPNRWQRVTMHLNTSGGFGSAEVWIEPLGGTKVKVTEYISGVGGFSWPISGPFAGHRTFRMPSTVGNTGGPWYDQWAYFMDFRIATSEAGMA